MGRGFTVVHIYGAQLKHLALAVPPVIEQAAIVRFLDHADRRIRRYIRAKQKLIKLLEEQKQAIIHRAVTRGLDPNVRLKPSGVEWLGNVPEHWRIERTKNLFRLRTQKSGRAHGMELLSIYTHIGVRPRKDLEEKGNKASTTDDYWIVRKGDLIVNKLLAWMGAVGVSEYEGVTSPAYDILMPSRPLCPAFYHHLFRTRLLLQQFKQRSRGIMDMRLRLYFDQLGQIPVVVPPVDEQSAIVAFYIAATTDLDRTIATAGREIGLLREYRTRLIGDVVTGKLDVREVAARLPQEAEDLDPVDETEVESEGQDVAAGDADDEPEEVEA
jgi:type I restriction enzyme S subunit